jgi:hypothetical protein
LQPSSPFCSQALRQGLVLHFRTAETGCCSWPWWIHYELPVIANLSSNYSQLILVMHAS